ncbi:GGDEF domain-containing protein [Bacillus swezeyi]|uniref:GGDEF domain-containing protein n=1 Tax=Bacillus swezeyi TaxID=1925020 RepID=A0A1R1RLS8_9BACI|nr:GGDEF domain-containing protein [Bacillus swezeyi]MEC1260032.1 GGDEF domain-containing protein [Bacillus swezeyi]MED2929736.1 GGDEF domain-containing protein [Bacillus swezeyi]MED2963237.1 GGDEF domain-containing protein [Bacillus swezeyi]MED3073188.1 GGDEF domain-containing protein [Bacillus swezeyi]MED3082733.1 GGDEF domain-containing protein [Bacillus swezeyi]
MFLIDLFLNLCILIALLFIYTQLKWNIISRKVTVKQLEWIDGLMGGLLGNLLMFFSIQASDETIIDLRYVPVMILFLFTGVFPAFICSLLIVGGRFIYGWNISSIVALIGMIFIFIGFYLILKIMGKDAGTYSRTFALVVFANLSISFVISKTLHDLLLLKILLTWYWILSTVGGFTSAYVVWYLRKSHFLLKKYEEESSIDFLTGLNNVRNFDAIWNAQISNAKEKNEKLSLLLIDVDYFKNINDTYGHSIGDAILKELGMILKKSTRTVDIVSRNGGEEFSVILPNCSNSRAAEIAERIRNEVEAHTFNISFSIKINITVSIGVVTFPEVIENTDELINKADQCLYKAKQLGRNRVCTTLETSV